MGFQTTWAKMFSTGLGHEIPAVLAIICAFMGGMALGSWLLAGHISNRPRQWFVALELVIGLWAFISAFVIPAANEAALNLIGNAPSPIWHWSVAFVIPFLVLAPATAAMGATLPVMERFFRAVCRERRCFGAVYASNTAGAVLGAIITTFFITPRLGLRETVMALGGVNIVCGVVALLVSSSRREEAHSHSERSEPRYLGRYIFATGFLGIGYETAGIRVLSSVLENTIYTFAAVLSVFLLGTSCGAASYQRFGRKGEFSVITTRLIAALALTCTAGMWIMSRAHGLYHFVRSHLGDSQSAVAIAEVVVAGTVFLLPTMAMGAFFTHLVQSTTQTPRATGRAIAMNTLGAALAPIIFGLCLFPLLGAKWTLVLISIGYVGLAAPFWSAVGGRASSRAVDSRVESAREDARPPTLHNGLTLTVVPVVTIAAALLLPAHLNMIKLSPGEQLREFHGGVMASVAVLEASSGHRSLRINHRFQQGGTAAANAEYLHAHIPLLLHRQPRNALFLGLGTGISFGAASLYPGLEADGVELVPEVVEAMDWFEPHNFSVHTDHPRLRIHVADARRFIRTAKKQYDVIVGDLFHPAMDGAGMLYTAEHFAAIRERLSTNALFCQWLPLYQLDEPVLRTIAATFLEVFPEAEAWLLRFNVDAPVIGLIARTIPSQYSRAWIERRLTDFGLREHLQKLSLADSIRFLGNLLLDSDGLRGFAANAPVNSDNMPRVVFEAPRFVYRRDAAPYETLAALLKSAREHPVAAGHVADTNLAMDLVGYWKARGLYLDGLIHEVEGREDQAVNAFLESARVSSKFTLGYARCITLASVQAQANPEKSRRLLERLVEAQPQQRLAKDMLEGLFPPESTPKQ